MIAASVVCLLNKKAQKDFITVFNSPLLTITMNIMKSITTLSTKKYIATHQINKEIVSSDYLRLTVHNKPDKSDIPAIYLLGTNGGNQLSQHCTMFIENNQEIRFITHYEAKLMNCVKVINANTSSLFHWCNNALLFYAKNNVAEIEKAIQAIKFIS